MVAIVVAIGTGRPVVAELLKMDHFFDRCPNLVKVLVILMLQMSFSMQAKWISQLRPEASRRVSLQQSSVSPMDSGGGGGAKSKRGHCGHCSQISRVPPPWKDVHVFRCEVWSHHSDLGARL